MEILSELGIVGLGLFVVAIVAAVLGVLRARRLGPSAAALTAVALASASLLVQSHTSVDWFWPYPAVTAPILGAARLRLRAGGARAGALARPLAAAHRHRSSRSSCSRSSAVPPFLSQRYVDDAYAEWRTDLAAGLRRSRSRPLAQPAQRPAAARRGLDRPGERRPRARARRLPGGGGEAPEEWATYYLLAEL